MTDCDVLIVGGGVMGCATAFNLRARDPAISVVVVEQDPTYERASTVLSDGNVRIQFHLEENIRISQYAMEVLDGFANTMTVGDIRPEVSARHQGNLFFTDAEGKAAALQGLTLQRSLGCEVEWMDASEIEASFPPYAAPYMAGGTFGPRDGSVDPSAVLRGYRSKAISMGVTFITGTVSGLRSERGAMLGADLADGTAIRSRTVVNCTGAWARDLLKTVGVDIPVDPVMRNVFVVDTAIDGSHLPSVFLPSGVYALPEHGTTFLIAWSQPDDPVGFDFVVHRHRFYDLIWPELVAHLPAFDRLHVQRGWAGLYAVNTLDGNAILGEWPLLRGLYLANGFSGHGFQQCHAVGRYLAELILGIEPELDLARLGPQRILDGRPLYEHAGRIV